MRALLFPLALTLAVPSAVLAQANLERLVNEAYAQVRAGHLDSAETLLSPVGDPRRSERRLDAAGRLIPLAGVAPRASSRHLWRAGARWRDDARGATPARGMSLPAASSRRSDRRGSPTGESSVSALSRCPARTCAYASLTSRSRLACARTAEGTARVSASGNSRAR